MNVRGQTTCLQRVYDLVNAYEENDFKTYCKGIIVNRLSLFALIPDAETPCVILNDGGESFVDAGKYGDSNAIEEVKVRVHKIEAYVVEKYLQESGLLIGDSARIGIIDFSHLVEKALLSQKKLNSEFTLIGYDNWETVDIDNPDYRDAVVACGRKMTLAYKSEPEVV
jgi:hypothetical protein